MNFFSDLSRRDSLDDGDHPHQSEFVVLKERKLVQIKQLRAGIQRFSIMMEMCGPGSVPDANFISAAFDLVYIINYVMTYLDFNFHTQYFYSPTHQFWQEQFFFWNVVILSMAVIKVSGLLGYEW